MVLTLDGGLLGTVGGGCGEAEVYELAQKMLSDETASGAVLHIDLTENPEDGGGKVCGGRFDVLLQRLTPELHTKMVRDVVQKLEAGQVCCWNTEFGDTTTGFWKDGLTQIDFQPRSVVESLVSTEVGWLDSRFSEPLGLVRKLVIVGAGHIARPLCDIAATVGYQVVVIDDRAEYASCEFFPRATAVLHGEYEEMLLPQCAHPELVSVVLVTRGHRHDQECLRLIAHLSLEYLGMIGSQRRIDAVFCELIEEGVMAEHLSRVSAPIGLEIGAQTPAEIAICILAEMIQKRRVTGDTSREPATRRRHLRSLSEFK